MHDIAVQRDRIHCFGTLMTAPPPPDDHEAGLNIGLMMPMLKNHEVGIQVGPGMEGRPQFFQWRRLMPRVDNQQP